MSKVVDVSLWQGDIDFVKMRETGVEDVIVRATMGASGADARFGENVLGASRAGLGVGVYHLWNSKLTWMSQLDNLATKMHIYSGHVWYQYIALDVEEDFRRNGWHMVNMNSWLIECERLLGIKPWIYTSIGYWNPWANDGPVDWAQDYPLWVCDPDSPDDYPELPSDWDTWHLWQYSGDGNGLGRHYGVSSGSVDLNRRNRLTTS